MIDFPTAFRGISRHRASAPAKTSLWSFTIAWRWRWWTCGGSGPIESAVKRITNASSTNCEPGSSVPASVWVGPSCFAKDSSKKSAATDAATPWVTTRWGRALAAWLEHCSTDEEVAGSILIGCSSIDVVFQTLRDSELIWQMKWVIVVYKAGRISIR